MKKIALITLLLSLFSSPAFSQGSSAEQALLGFLSSATTGNAGCTSRGLGKPPCWLPYDNLNPLPISTSGGGSSVVWPTTGDVVISNSTNSPAGVAEVDGDFLVGVGGQWVAGAGGSTIGLANTTSNLTYYLGFTTSTSGTTATLYGNSANLFFNPSTGVLNALGLTTTTLLGVNANLSGTTTLATAQIGAGNALLTTLTATTANLTNMALSGTATIGTLEVLTNSSLAGTTTISTAQIAAGNATLTNLIATTVTGTTGHFPTLTFTTGTGTNLSLAGTITASGLSSGTVAASSFLGLNSSNQVVLSASSLTPAAGSSGNIQYNGGSGFAANAGLNVSTTRGGIDFLANVTTANLLSLGNNGADATSYALGESALLAQSTTNRDNTAIGGFSLTALTTGTNNTALGWDSGQTITVGTNNTVLGNAVGSTTLTIGSDNILIGVNSAIDGTTSSETNSIHIGGTGGDWVHVTGTNTNSTESTSMNGALNITASVANLSATGVSNVTDTANTQFQLISNLFAPNLGVGNEVYQTIGVNANLGNSGGLVFYYAGNGSANNRFALSFASTKEAVEIYENTHVLFNTTTANNLTAPPDQVDIQGGLGFTLTTATVPVNGFYLPSANTLEGTTSGFQSILINSTGNDNTGLGFKALTAITTGINNVAVGYQAAKAMTVDGFNNAFGTNSLLTQAGASTTSATGNTAVGYAALTALTTGTTNVAVGNNAGLGVTVGINNVLLGNNAGALLTTGTGNVLLGYTASPVLTIGSDNILIGQGVAATTSADTNTINIGGIYKATGIGTPSTSQATIAGALNVTATLQQGIELSCATGLTTDGSGNINGCVASDASLKQNVQPLIYDPTMIDRLQPVSYEWKEPVRYDDRKHSGFIAQQVQIVDPLAVKSAGKDLLGLDNSALAADIVLDLQNIHREIDGNHITVAGHVCFFGLLVCAN